MTDCKICAKEGICCCQCVHLAIVKKWAYQDVNWQQYVCTYFYDLGNGPLIYNDDGHGLCECFTQKDENDGPSNELKELRAKVEDLKYRGCDWILYHSITEEQRAQNEAFDKVLVLIDKMTGGDDETSMEE